MGDRFTDLLETYRQPIETHVTENLFDRHIVPLFLDDSGPERR